MADRFTEVTTTGYGKRISNSIGGIIVGVLFFFGSFIVLYNNEGSVDYSQIAKTAVEIKADTAVTDPAMSEKLLVTTAPLISAETLDDGQFLKPGKYLVLERKVEMYSWEEDEKTSTQSSAGGSETTTRTYEYKKTWSSSPENSADFRYPADHSNPSLPFGQLQKRVSDATIGMYNVDMQSITLPELNKLTLTAENTDLKTVDLPLINNVNTAALSSVTPAVLAQPGNAAPNTPQLMNGEFLYISRSQGASFAAPQIGDIRISYRVLNNETKVTLFGKLNDKTFGPYLDGNNNRFYQLFLGTKEEAIVSLHQSYVMWIWIVRGIGFLMMWIGLSMILAPIKVLTDFLPFLGMISGGLIGIITFVTALVLSGVTILVAMVFHNVVALVAAIIIVLAVVFMVLKNKGIPTTAGPGPGQTTGPGGITPANPS